MAWKSIIESGDVVNTPHGTGKVRRVSASQDSSHVEVDGVLYEVPNESITQIPDDRPSGEGDQKGTPFKTNPEIKRGVKVQKPGGGTGRIIKETQRSATVKWDANGRVSTFNKKSIIENQSILKAPEQDEIQVGDEVKLIKKNGGYAEVGDIGKVTSKYDGGFQVDFPSQSDYYVENEHIEKVKKDEPKKSEEKEQERQEERAERDKDTVARDSAEDIYGLFNLRDRLIDKIDKEVEGELKELKDAVKKNQKLEVKVGDKVNVIQGLKHKQLEQLIRYAMLRLSPLLVGMAGTGKTHAGQQTAEALGLPFFAISVGAQTTKTDIMGYTDANGQYVRTHFRDAYEYGGVFLMDEIDAGNANVLITINAALSNGLAAFPDAMVAKHEDFVFIASANTFGNGASRQYVGRNQLDAATLDRFAIIEWFIDDDLEESLSCGLNGKAWYMAVRASRDYVAEKNIRALISPRATQKGSRLLDIGQPLDEVIDATMLGSVPQDKKQDVRQVATQIFEKFASNVPKVLPVEVDPPTAQDLVKDAIPF